MKRKTFIRFLIIIIVVVIVIIVVDLILIILQKGQLRLYRVNINLIYFRLIDNSTDSVSRGNMFDF